MLKTEMIIAALFYKKRLQAAITGKWADQKECEALGEGFKFSALDKQINTHAILQSTLLLPVELINISKSIKVYNY